MPLLLRPSIVLARNPNRNGNLWPARLCDRDEVEESFAHSDLGAEAQVCSGTVRYGVVRHGTVGDGVACCGAVCGGMVRHVVCWGVGAGRDASRSKVCLG